jgi:cystathionine gamma-synthase
MSGGFGGIVSLRLQSPEAAREFVTATRIFGLSVSLGGVESLICLPTEMTHGPLQGTDREIPPDLVRLSAGIENADDLIADLDQALATAVAVRRRRAA